MSIETKVVTAEVPLPLAEQLDRLARRLERPAASIVQEALREWLDQQDERFRLTLEGLAEVDAGRLIDHAAVRAWADSLDTDPPLPPPQ